MARNTKSNKKMLPIALIVLILLLLGTGITLLLLISSENGSANLYLKTDAKLVAMSQEEFYIDVKLSDFPEDGVYPASSFVLNFDQDKLEFEGLRLGTMSVGDEENGSAMVPIWQCNPDISNERGEISAMYIDMTAKDSSYRSFGFTKNSNDILVRLQFTLKDSASAGDKLDFVFNDAVLASVNTGNENNSLSMVDNTLKAKEYSLKVK